jgi:hypothetical protein
MSHIANTPGALGKRGPRFMSIVVLAIALFSIVPTTQARASQDLRSPDARDAARRSQATQGQDLRSPDARDAARATHHAQTAAGDQDLRSPDARDAARVGPQTPAVPPGSSGDFEWVYLAFGGLGLILMAALAATIRHKRRRPERPALGVHA